MKRDLTEFFKTQVSLTDWFGDINHKQTAQFRVEDNEKRERLKILNQIFNLPFDKPTQFTTFDLINNSPKFKKFLKEHGQETCSIRIIPLDTTQAKLRTRGHLVKDSIKWFFEQKIDPLKNRVEFVPHTDYVPYSTSFIVNNKGIFGEGIKGMPYQLTQGVHDEGDIFSFSYDFKSWRFSTENKAAQNSIKKMVKKILIKDKSIQLKLKKAVQAEFAHHFLKGYFEALETRDFGIWYCDYNRILGRLYQDFNLNLNEFSSSFLKGQTGHPGKVLGTVQVVLDFKTPLKEDILVCPLTTPQFLPLMKKAKAIITDMGGVLSHAAIVARELKIPCLVATKNATTLLKTGDKIELNATEGVVRKI